MPMIRPRRSLLFMPGANVRALEKARELPADGLIFDLEDAVAPAAKEKARENVGAPRRGKRHDERNLAFGISCGAVLRPRGGDCQRRQSGREQGTT